MADLSDDLLDEFKKINFFTAYWFSTQFLEDVQEDGLNSALHSLRSSNDRRSYLRRLDRYKLETFSIDNLNSNKPHEMLSFLIQKGTRQELLAS